MKAKVGFLYRELPVTATGLSSPIQASVAGAGAGVGPPVEKSRRNRETATM